MPRPSSQHRATSYPSRRTFGLAIGLAAIGIFPGGTHIVRAQDRDDDDTFVMRLVARGGALPYRAIPYRLTRPVIVPAGTTLVIHPGVHIVYHPARAPAVLTGVFVAGGDAVAIVVEGGQATVECSPPSHLVYTAAARGVDGFTVRGLTGIDCNHVMVDGGPPGGGYDDIITTGARRNVARNIHVEGGGARFANRPSAGHAACLMRYAFDWSVTGSHYRNTLSGVEWWGGDANPVTGNGAARNERKTGRFVVRRVTTSDTTISGIWGSMGHGGIVADCTIERAGDVGFDAEGSRGILFRGCLATDGANGCFGVFFLNSDIVFEDCQAVSTHSDLPVFRVHNPTLDMANNRRIAIRGGRWECRDHTGTSTMDIAGGPCAELTVEAAELVNVRIDTAFVGVHATRIVGNRLTFPFALTGKAAIRVGGSKTLDSPVPGNVLVADNVVVATSATAAAAIEIYEDDTISSASAIMRDNRLSGPFATGIRIVNGSPNPAVRPSVALVGNRFAQIRGALTDVVVEKPHMATPAVT